VKRNGKPYLVDVETLAEALALSRARTYDLVQRGVLPRAARGRYDLIACVRAYIGELRAERGDPDVLALRRTKAARAELELAARRRALARDEAGPLVPLAEAQAFLGQALDEYAAVLCRLAAEAAPRLVNIEDPRRMFATLDALVVAAINASHRAACLKLVGRDPGANGDGRVA
jgi:hypothetical protein